MTAPPSPAAPDPGGSSPRGPGAGPDPRTRVLRRQLIAWLSLGVFLICVVWSGPLARAILQVAARDVRPDPVVRASTEIELIGRVQLGLETLASGANPAFDPRQLAEFLSGLDEAALGDAATYERFAVQQLRAIAVAAEFLGAEFGAENLVPLLTADPEELPEGLGDDARLLALVYAEGADTLTDAEHERLSDRHGWIGRLGASFGLPDDHPRRAPVVAAALRSVTGVGLITVVGIAGVAAGMALFVVAAVLAARGRLRPAYHPDRDLSGARHTAFLETVALFFGGLAALNIAGAVLVASSGPGGLSPGVALGAFVAQWGLLLPAFWPLLRGVTWAELTRGLGWTRGKGVARELAMGIVGYVAGVPVIAIGALLTLLIAWLFGQTPSHPITEGGDRGWAAVLMMYALAAVWAPIVEETIFRGAFYHHLRRWMGPAATAIVVALVFAVAHPQGLAAVPALTSIALVFAGLREWRGSALGAIAAHAVHNAAIVSLFVLVLM
jgi:membrane protease YdiL (CAAX protease family)